MPPQDAASCLDSWIYLCQLLQNPAVAERAPDAAASLEVLSATWRKLNMAAMEQTSLTAAAVALQVRAGSRCVVCAVPNRAETCWPDVTATAALGNCWPQGSGRRILDPSSRSIPA